MNIILLYYGGKKICQELAMILVCGDWRFPSSDATP